MILIVVGKRGKMQRMTTAMYSLPGWAACSLLPGEIRHSLVNGAMEKGASASALSSTSGDEMFVLPFLWDRVNPGPGSLIPSK